ncbi:MAG: hypothetical protein AB9903_05020 [Vulcanimicrobiota bacterium]
MVQSVIDRGSELFIEHLSHLPLEGIVTFHIERYENRHHACNAKMLIEEATYAAASVIAPSIYDALDAFGISFKRSRIDHQFPEIIYRAELIPSENKITVFGPSLEELRALIGKMPLFHSMQGREEEMILSHELSHYLESLERCRSVEPPLFKEIRAHLFTMKYLSLSFYPWICDVLQLLYRNPKLIDRFQAGELDNRAKKKKGQ